MDACLGSFELSLDIFESSGGAVFTGHGPYWCTIKCTFVEFCTKIILRLFNFIVFELETFTNL